MCFFNNIYSVNADESSWCIHVKFGVPSCFIGFVPLVLCLLNNQARSIWVLWPPMEKKKEVYAHSSENESWSACWVLKVMRTLNTVRTDGTAKVTKLIHYIPCFISAIILVCRAFRSFLLGWIVIIRYFFSFSVDSKVYFCDDNWFVWFFWLNVECWM